MDVEAIGIGLSGGARGPDGVETRLLMRKGLMCLGTVGERRKQSEVARIPSGISVEGTMYEKTMPTPRMVVVRGREGSEAPILDPILPTGLLAFNFHAVTRSDLAFSSSGSHSSTLATDMRTEEDASHSTLRVREEITATADIPSQLSLLSPVTGIAIDGFSTRSLGTEHIERRPPDAVVVDRSAVRHTPLSDVEVPSSPTLGLPIGML